MRDAIYGTVIKVGGNPSTTRSYLYPTDMTDWLLAILVEPHDDVLHVGSRIPLRMSELAQKISETFNGTPISHLRMDVPSSNYVPETRVMQSTYGVNQRISLDEGILRWANWLKTR